jgi:4-amino-4-deoxy-L-arabinose transferase-like glycosyltransferase
MTFLKHSVICGDIISDCAKCITFAPRLYLSMNTFSLSESTNNYLAKIVVIGVLLVLIFGVTVFPLFDNQESINVITAAQMLENHNWLRPGAAFPPLNTWLMAFSQKLFGVNEFSARFPAMLFMALTFLTLFFHVNRFDRQLGMAALVVFAGNVAVGLIGNVGLHYSPLLFFVTTMVIGFQRYLIYEQPGWLVLISFMLAMALLTDGPAILIFVLILMIKLTILHPKGRWLLKPRVILSLAIAVLPLVLWVYAVEQQEPGFVMEFIERNGYIWTFTESLSLPFFSHWETLVFVFAFLPFAVFIPRAIFRTAKVFFRKGAPKQFFAIWAISAWIPYIILGGKVAWLSMISFPAFSVIVASIMLDWSRQVKKFSLLFAPVVQASVLGVGLIIASSTMAYLMKPGSWVYIIVPGALLSLGALLLIWKIRRCNAREKFRRWLMYGLISSFAFWFTVPHAFRHHWGVVRYMVKSTKKADHIFVDADEIAKHPSLHVYLMKYVPGKFVIVKEGQSPKQLENAVYIRPLTDNLPEGTRIFSGKISGGVGEVAYGVIKL